MFQRKTKSLGSLVQASDLGVAPAIDISPRKTILVDRQLPDIYTILSPNKERIIAVKCAGSDNLYTRLSNAPQFGEKIRINDNWKLFPVDFEVFLQLFIVSVEIVHHSDGITESIYMLQNTGHKVILSGRDAGCIIISNNEWVYVPQPVM